MVLQRNNNNKNEYFNNKRRESAHLFIMKILSKTKIFYFTLNFFFNKNTFNGSIIINSLFNNYIHIFFNITLKFIFFAWHFGTLTMAFKF